MSSICAEAQATVAQRQEGYGHPLEDFARTAAMWQAILSFPVTPEQVALCLIAVKISRECHQPKRDNRVDIAGYAETLEQVHAAQGSLPPMAPIIAATTCAHCGGYTASGSAIHTCPR